MVYIHKKLAEPVKVNVRFYPMSYDSVQNFNSFFLKEKTIKQTYTAVMQ